MDIAIQLCTGGSLTFVTVGCSYYWYRRKQNEVELLDGPSPSAHVVLVRVWAGAFVDHVDFVFSDGYVASHGQRAGGTQLVDFVLNEGETISAVRGQCGNFVDSIQFVLSSGRVSPLYGGGGGSTFYSFDIGEPIGGLSVSLSARGWFSHIAGVWSVVDMSVPLAISESTRRQKDYIRQHRITQHVENLLPKRKTYLRIIFVIITFYLVALFPLLALWVRGGLSLEDWMELSAAPAVTTILEGNTIWQQWQQFNGDERDMNDLDPDALSSVVNDALRNVVIKYGGYVRLPDIPHYDRKDGSWQVSGEWHSMCLSRGNVKHQWFMIPYRSSLESMVGGESAKEVVGKQQVPHHDRLSSGSNLILVKSTKESSGAWSMVYWSERLALSIKSLLNPSTSLSSPFPTVPDVADDVGGFDSLAPYLRYGMIREFQVEDWGTSEHDVDKQRSNMPIFYVDTSFQPFVLLVVFTALQVFFTVVVVMQLCLMWGNPRYHPVYACLVDYIGVERDTLEELVSSIESELSDVGSVTAVEWGNNTIVCSANWLLVFREFSMDAVRLEDVRVESVKLVLRYSGAERVDVVVLAVARHVNGCVRRFRLECPQHAFPRLQHAVVTQRRESVLKEVRVELENQLSSEWERHMQTTNPNPTPPTREHCMGECGALANVRIIKRCTTCDERDECHCDPSWCHQCILKWWIEKNATKLDMGTTPTLAWQTRCPTCRVFFCLKDLVPIGPLVDEETFEVNPQPTVEIGTETAEMNRQAGLGGVALSSSPLLHGTNEDDEMDEETLLAIALSVEAQDTSEPGDIPTNEQVSTTPRRNVSELVHTSVTNPTASAGVEVGMEAQTSVPSASELRRLRLARFE